jgi:hypothetical protein
MTEGRADHHFPNRAFLDFRTVRGDDLEFDARQGDAAGAQLTPPGVMIRAGEEGSRAADFGHAIDLNEL